MVVNFTRVVARDCFAYKYLDFRFENGIHSVIGNNGASKTSLFLTLIQGLFNQNPKGTKIADVNNEITGQPYEIEIWFTKGASEWHVKNSKKTGEIEIYEEVNGAKHKRHLKRIPDNLKFIEEVLETDYSTFVDLVYQSPKSSLNLLESSSDGERKKFISRVNRLDELDAEFDRMKEKEKGLAGKHGKILMLQKNIELMEQGVVHPQPELEEVEVAELESKLKLLWVEVDSLKAQQLELSRDRLELAEKLKTAEANQATQSKIQELEKELKDFQVPALAKEDAQSRATKLQEELRTTESLLQEAQGVLARYQSAKPQIDRLVPLREELAGLETPEVELEFAEEQISKIENLRTKTQANVSQRETERLSLQKSSESGACPTCGHGVDPTQFEGQIAELFSQIETGYEILNKCSDSLSKYRAVQKAWQEITRKTQELEKLEANPDTKIDGNQAQLDVSTFADRKRRISENLQEAVGIGMEHLLFEQKQNELNRLRAEVGPAVEADPHELDEIDMATAEVTSMLVSVKNEVSQIDTEVTKAKDHNALSRARKELNRQVEENNRDLLLRLAASRNELSNAESTLEDIRNWLGILGPKGYRVRKIDRFLRSFNILIRKYSEMITSGRIACVFYLDEDGEVQFTVTDSHKTVKWANWSEGEKARVKMSCLFATLEILEATGSSSFNVLCLDEIFGSLDEEGKAGLFAVLDHLRGQNKALFTIAHSELALAMTYDSVIRATKHEDGTTSIQQ